VRALSRTTKLWKQRHVWELIDDQISLNEKGMYAWEALGIIRGMLQSASREADAKKELFSRVKMEYKSGFLKIIGTPDEFRSKYVGIIIDILGHILKEDEMFFIAWKEWKKGARQIKDDEMYAEFIRPFVQILQSANRNLKQSIKKELYDLLNDPNANVRTRGLRRHSELFAN